MTAMSAQKHYYRDQKEKLEGSTVKCVEIVPFFFSFWGRNCYGFAILDQSKVFNFPQGNIDYSIAYFVVLTWVNSIVFVIGILMNLKVSCLV